MTTLQALRASLNANVNSRVAYETDKAAHSAATKVARYFAYDFKAKTCEVSDAMLKAAQSSKLKSFDYINDSQRSTNRFNVYAIEKTRNMLRAIASNSFTMCDKYTVAVISTLEKQRDNDAFAMTRKHAYANVSHAMKDESVKLSDLASRINVAASTATTQISSTLRALAALNVLQFNVETKVVSDVNFDHSLFETMRVKTA